MATIRLVPGDPKGPPGTSLPYGGSSLACRCPARVDPVLCSLSWRFGAPRSLVCGRIAGVSGSPLPPRPRVFTRAHAASPSAVRPTFRWGFILPRASPPPSESCGLRAALRARLNLATQPDSEERLPWGPVPHRDIGNRRPPLRGESQPRGHVPPSTFLTSSTVCSASCLHGLVSSRCHVQGLPFRGLFLTAEPYRVSPADSCPPGVGRTRL